MVVVHVTQVNVAPGPFGDPLEHTLEFRGTLRGHLVEEIGLEASPHGDVPRLRAHENGVEIPIAPPPELFAEGAVPDDKAETG